MKVITENRIPIKMWLDDMEESAMKQATDLASLPFAFKHIAIMPDAHTGIGMPIGGVLATKGVIVPNAVGVDIGCGMCAVKTNVKGKRLKRKTLEKITDEIRQVIPRGFNHHKKAEDEAHLPQGYNIDEMPKVRAQYKAVLKQVGTLGGGNHFIEIQKSAGDDVWIMVHSGSRNLGHQVASHYAKIAKSLNKQWYSESLPELEFLPIENEHAKKYFQEMNYCVDFAFANRKLMMDRVCNVLKENVSNAEFEPMINIAHNFAAWENHFNTNVIVHRKGATRAFKGELGIIPGSQGTKSYIVEGLGNPESFMSCSHGAGRVMGRREAVRSLNLEKEMELMNRQGIVHSITSQKHLDEATSAYKDIDNVMNNQADLVRPVVELFPMAVVKG